MDISETMARGVRVVTLAGRLDTATAPAVEARLLALLDGGVKLVADVADLHYVSAAGLNVLLRVARHAQEGGGTLALAAPPQAVRELLEASGFDRIVPIHASRDDAIAGLA